MVLHTAHFGVTSFKAQQNSKQYIKLRICCSLNPSLIHMSVDRTPRILFYPSVCTAGSLVVVVKLSHWDVWLEFLGNFVLSILSLLFPKWFVFQNGSFSKMAKISKLESKRVKMGS
jgi:hypothetical protein